MYTLFYNMSIIIHKKTINRTESIILYVYPFGNINTCMHCSKHIFVSTFIYHMNHIKIVVFMKNN